MNTVEQPIFLPKKNSQSSEILDQFIDCTQKISLSLYPAQEEAILEIMNDKNIILATPTGSGKSLVALAMHFKALAEGKRSFYTSPIKALVSEKFFDLCNKFGASNVGMLTGDASINRDAPIICCTAEILSNLALNESEHSSIHYAILDEFHYYADKERGVAWQIPILLLKNTTFLLMSATLGDMQKIETALTSLNGRSTCIVRSEDRPVPLDFLYRETPMHETLHDLMSSHKFPVYVVNFTQRECLEQAQNAMSVDICTKDEKKNIQNAIGNFRFDTPFGKDVKRFISHGIGIHHAGILPKYRLLVEKLAQEGLLKVIMGTDTLGVGINIPIRTVLFTKLYKFDGQKLGILSVRDFKQIAGRAGRKGFDDQGSVVCQAPDHVIENKKQENKFAAGEQKKKNFVKKGPPPNFVHYDEKTFQKLIHGQSEPLTSQFSVSHGMIITMLQSDLSVAKRGYQRLVALIAKSHETDRAKSKHRQKAAMLFKSLITAGIISLVKNALTGTRVVVNDTLQKDFSLNHALSLFLLEILPHIDSESETYALDVMSVTESILENPQSILRKQIDKLRLQKLAELKADGMEYDERMEELEKVEHPKPLADFIYGLFNAFRAKHPWVGQENIHPKLVAREFYERSMTFNEFISEYGLQRSEGEVLRYLSSFYKAEVQNVPDGMKSESLYEVEAFFRLLLGKVDTSLIDAWESMLTAKIPSSSSESQQQEVKAVADINNPHLIIAAIRTQLWELMKYLSRKDYAEASAGLKTPCNDFESSLKDFYAENEAIVFNAQTKSAKYTSIKKTSDNYYTFQQTICDSNNNNDWIIEGEVDISSASSLAEPLLAITSIHS